MFLHVWSSTYLFSSARFTLGVNTLLRIQSYTGAYITQVLHRTLWFIGSSTSFIEPINQQLKYLTYGEGTAKRAHLRFLNSLYQHWPLPQHIEELPAYKFPQNKINVFQRCITHAFRGFFKANLRFCLNFIGTLHPFPNEKQIIWSEIFCREISLRVTKCTA